MLRSLFVGDEDGRKDNDLHPDGTAVEQREKVYFTNSKANTGFF